jgi:hypothetical protein
MSKTEAPESGKVASQKKPRHRSPNYPQITLEKAIARAQAIYDKEGNGRHWVRPEVLASHLEMTPKGSSWNSTVAALRTFGLLETDGRGDERRERLSDEALRVLLGAADRQEILAKMAISPKIYADIWARYHGVLPSNKALETDLQLEWKINRQSVNAFIADLSATFEFANPPKPSNVTDVPVVKNDPGDEDEEGGPGGDAVTGNGGVVDEIPPPAGGKPKEDQRKMSATTASGYHTIQVPLGTGRFAPLDLPDDLTDAELKTFLALVGPISSAVARQPLEAQRQKKDGKSGDAN